MSAEFAKHTGCCVSRGAVFSLSYGLRAGLLWKMMSEQNFKEKIKVIQATECDSSRCFNFSLKSAILSTVLSLNVTKETSSKLGKEQ